MRQRIGREWIAGGRPPVQLEANRVVAPISPRAPYSGESPTTYPGESAGVWADPYSWSWPRVSTDAQDAVVVATSPAAPMR